MYQVVMNCDFHLSFKNNVSVAVGADCRDTEQLKTQLLVALTHGVLLAQEI